MLEILKKQIEKIEIPIKDLDLGKTQIIILPFYDVIGDHLTMCITNEGNGFYTIDDDWYTINNVEILNGIEFKAIPPLIERVAKRYGLETIDGSISKRVEEEKILSTIIDLIQAILIIDGYYYFKE